MLDVEQPIITAALAALTRTKLTQRTNLRMFIPKSNIDDLNAIINVAACARVNWTRAIKRPYYSLNCLPASVASVANGSANLDGCGCGLSNSRNGVIALLAGPQHFGAVGF